MHSLLLSSFIHHLLDIYAIRSVGSNQIDGIFGLGATMTSSQWWGSKYQVSPQDDLFKVQVRQSDACDRQATAQSPFHLPRGSRGPLFSLLRRQLWTTLPWGSLRTQICHLHLVCWHSEEQIKVLNQQAREPRYSLGCAPEPP